MSKNSKNKKMLIVFVVGVMALSILAPLIMAVSEK